jgi:hypothetical protein
MQRREFVTLLGGAAATWPLAAGAQQPDAMRRIGVMMNLPEADRSGRAQANAIKWLVPQACFKLTGSVLPDAPFLDGGRAGTKPNDFELLRPPPRPFQKASPARRRESQATMRARLCPTSVRIRELNYSSSLDHSEKSL